MLPCTKAARRGTRSTSPPSLASDLNASPSLTTSTTSSRPPRSPTSTPFGAFTSASRARPRAACQIFASVRQRRTPPTSTMVDRLAQRRRDTHRPHNGERVGGVYFTRTALNGVRATMGPARTRRSSGEPTGPVSAAPPLGKPVTRGSIRSRPILRSVRAEGHEGRSRAGLRRTRQLPTVIGTCPALTRHRRLWLASRPSSIRAILSACPGRGRESRSAASATPARQ